MRKKRWMAWFHDTISDIHLNRPSDLLRTDLFPWRRFYWVSYEIKLPSSLRNYFRLECSSITNIATLSAMISSTGTSFFCDGPATASVSLLVLLTARLLDVASPILRFNKKQKKIYSSNSSKIKKKGIDGQRGVGVNPPAVRARKKVSSSFSSPCASGSSFI